MLLCVGCGQEDFIFHSALNKILLLHFQSYLTILIACPKLTWFSQLIQQSSPSITPTKVGFQTQLHSMFFHWSYRQKSTNTFNIKFVKRLMLVRYSTEVCRRSCIYRQDKPNHIKSSFVSIKFCMSYEFEIKMNRKLEYFRKSCPFSIKLSCHLIFILIILYQNCFIENDKNHRAWEKSIRWLFSLAKKISWDP